LIYKSLSVLNGAFIALMIFINGLLAMKAGPFLGTLIFYFVGLSLILIISFATGNKLSKLATLPWLFFLPGVIGVMTTLVNNAAMPKLGVMLVSGLALFGQLVMSAGIEHFGLFGMPKSPLRPSKMLGFTFISLGILAMIIL